MECEGKKILVAGLARSGLAAAKLLCAHGAQVLLYDMKTDLPDVREALEGLAVAWHLGEDPLALALACDMVVLSPGIDSAAPWVQGALAAGRQVIGELELGARFVRAPIVAVTGTNGKTTTCSLLGSLMQNAGKLVQVAGNIGNPLTSVADAMKPQDVAVVEVSSFQLETVAGFHPAVSAVLNVSPDHLNRHGSMQKYTALKERIFEEQGGADCVVLNWDDPITRAMAERVKARTFYFSLKERPPLGAWVQDGQVYTCLEQGGEAKHLCGVEDVHLPGEHNLMNALCAAVMARVCDVPAPVVRHTLRTFEGVEHRIETVRETAGACYINDSKGTNVDASMRAIHAMKKDTVLIAGGYDKQGDFAPLAQAIQGAGHIVGVVLIGQTAGQIQEALRAAGYGAIARANSLEEAVGAARAMLKGEGNILLSPACASFDMYADYEERGRDFKRIVAAL